MAGGLPAGAMLSSSKVSQNFTPGSHASTFGGNPVVMAACVAVMKELIEGDVLENCNRMGDYFFEKLTGLKHKYPDIIREIRGKGLIIGMELEIDGKNIVQQCLDEGIIINCTMDRILRFLPPLIIKKEEIDRCVDVLNKIFGSL
jgi:acetylornithine/succinyldiaminopimelate/putrescine aminotransferase